MKKIIKVVAAIIENEDQEILCALRSPRMSTPYFWEFPGGKVEKDEDIYTALKREIKEELRCQIETIEQYTDTTYEYENVGINLITIRAKIISGTPVPNEHSKLIWLKKENLSSLKWAPADLPAVQQLMNKE
ncbi:(deoxy)nucleoside triphosphate pyrophosphohydrolase [Anaerobacillus sp. MEB173]|uniref:(deoxy)nucleoside triphosphate pyrophosphohydrolase n=1 Tax=Anaerobacillus sp. MEB173 TaxID=3383345 RepID=UPI003F8F1CA3